MRQIHNTHTQKHLLMGSKAPEPNNSKPTVHSHTHTHAKHTQTHTHISYYLHHPQARYFMVKT
eukprot:EC712965.1.p2 GENE.EC712965.1~~EC712965.1.p2  ORF type:complete len:63 (-),score=3.86 EC712965.1:86-274(-)